jgi:acyl carrier protein
MNENEFYGHLEELLEVPAGSIARETALKDLEAWDSLAVISFIAMVDSNYGLTLPAKRIAAAVTVNDLAALIQEQKAQTAGAR